ncbi:MAG: hypothetical protein Kow00124_05290 [Anaerolineae bacterium]
MGIHIHTVVFDETRSAPALIAPPGGTAAAVRQALGVAPPRGAVALVGGAGGLDTPAYTDVRARLVPLLDVLARLCSRERVAIVDGGTPYGVMRLLGEARHRLGGALTLIGVGPLGMVTWPGRPAGEGGDTPLDPNHSHFVLVEGEGWGAESQMLAGLAYELGGADHVLEIVINGGEVTRHDVSLYRQGGGPLLVIEGTGRLADELAAASRAGTPGVGLHLFPLGGAAEDFEALLRRLLNLRG